MAITRIQYKNGNNGGGLATITITLDSAPISGNLLVACATAFTLAADTVASITQVGVTWTRQVLRVHAGIMPAEIWAGVVGDGANATLVITYSGLMPFGAVGNVCEYSGLLTAGFLDQTASAEGVGILTDTGTTALTTVPVELWIGCINSNNTQINPTNGFTLLDGVQFGGDVSCAYLEKIVAAVGTANSGADTVLSDYSGVIATFKTGGMIGLPKVGVGL